MSKKYIVISKSKDNQKHEWSCEADSKDDAIAITKHLLDVVKGWSNYQYKVESVERIKV